MARKFDVVLVGGGIMGCCSAFELARRGFKVVVLDKSPLGGGSTGRSSAIIRQHYSNELTAAMALYGLGVFRDFDDVVGGECGFTRTGFLALVSSKDRAGLEANVALQRRVGIETEILDGDDVGRLMPGVVTGDIAGAAYEAGSGYADPHLTLTAYADAARRHGASVVVDAEVTGVRMWGDRVVGVDTIRGGYDAPVVVNCAGPWAAGVARMTGSHAPIDACRIQVATFRRPPARRGPHPVVLDFIHASYFRAETGGLTLVGLIDPAEADAIVDPDDYQEHIDAEFVEDVGGRWMGRWPALEDSESTGGYCGLYGVTPDWHPIIDEVPAGSGNFICAGFSGHGFKLAPAVGLMMADLIAGEPSPRFPNRLFRADRFVTDALVRGTYEYSITG